MSQPQIVPARHGWQWLMRAGDLLGANLAAFALIGALWLLISLLQMVPVLGPLVLALLAPGLQAGVMSAFDQALAGRTPPAGSIFGGLLEPRRRPALLALGGIALGYGVLVVLLAQALLAAAAPGWQEAIEPPDLEFWAAHGDAVLLTVGVVLAALALAMLAFFFAVPRVMFDGHRPGASLLESVSVGLRNWRALLMFGLAALTVAAGGFILLMILVSLLIAVAGNAAMPLASLLIMIYALALQLLSTGGGYLAWREVFGAGGEGRGDPDADAPGDRLYA